MRYEIIHRTHYAYSSDVSVSHHLARLTPRLLPRQSVAAHTLETSPGPSLLGSHDDYFGNRVTFFTTSGFHRELLVTARSVVEVLPRDESSAANTPAWETLRDACVDNAPSVPPRVQEFVFASPIVPRLPALADYARESFAAGRPLLEAVLDLTRRIHRDFRFDRKATTVFTPLEQVIRNRCGVCQDFVHFEIGCLRTLGLPARYVSGYLETLPPPGRAKLVGADASHAWVQVFVPGAGWIDVDPTNNMLPSDRHITVAWGRDFDEVSPIRGVIVGGGKHQLNVGVDVIPQPAVENAKAIPTRA